MFTFIKKLFTKQITSKILCPYHTEKSPSLVVNHTNNQFKCFGCGKNGTTEELLSFMAGSK